MKIINREHVLKNSQLNRLIDVLGDSYRPAVLVVCENRRDLIRYFMTIPQLFASLADISLWIGKTEGFYLNAGDIVVICLFAQTDDGPDLHSIQLYSLHALLHELFHRWQAHQVTSMNEEDEETAADQFATSYINQQSALIAEIMEWDDEWTMWED